ncbi:MAG: hypothetical protein QM762_09930 [Chryseolinea sp.]
MKLLALNKIALACYFVFLLLMAYMYYYSGHLFYAVIPDKIAGTPFVVAVGAIGPLLLMLGIIRFLLLKLVGRKYFAIHIQHFIIPFLISIVGLSHFLWTGIILSLVGGVMVALELLVSCYKASALLKAPRQS